MTAKTIYPLYGYLTFFLPFNFMLTAIFVEKLVVIDKEEGIISIGRPLGMSGISLGSIEQSVYLISVLTRYGSMQLTVSEETFKLLDVGDSIVVSYRRGRWTGDLKGKIAK